MEWWEVGAVSMIFSAVYNLGRVLIAGALGSASNEADATLALIHATDARRRADQAVKTADDAWKRTLRPLDPSLSPQIERQIRTVVEGGAKRAAEAVVRAEVKNHVREFHVPQQQLMERQAQQAAAKAAMTAEVV